MFFKPKGYTEVDDLIRQLIKFLKDHAVKLVYRDVYYRQVVISFSPEDTDHWKPYREELCLQIHEKLSASLSQGEDHYHPEIFFVTQNGKTRFSGSFEKETIPNAW